MKITSLIISLPIPIRRRLILLVDILLINLSFILVFSFNEMPDNLSYFNTLIYTLIIIIFYLLTGSYKSITRFASSYTAYSLATKNLIALVLISILDNLLKANIFNQEILVKVWFFISIFNISSRFLIRDFLKRFKSPTHHKTKFKEKLIIYGAGEAGSQLAQTIIADNIYKIECFVDDSPYLWNRSLYGIPVKSSENLEELNEKISKILIAMPSIEKTRMRKIVEKLKNYKFNIYKIPSIYELTNGFAEINKVRPVLIEDLLGREPVQPNLELMQKCIRDKVVCIIGAGGSIGGELCRQVIINQPKELILIEMSEINLYKIKMELESKIKNISIIKAYLGDASDDLLINNIFSKSKVDLVFHTAAYKHVPIVEENPIEGIKNNLKTTEVLCRACIKNNIKQMILISSDKAVRPTNIMGASKRLSELVVKAYSKQQLRESKDDSTNYTNFSMVRFGNVLGSSGSVIPLFKKQIIEGGPITVTDPNVLRYFMTLQESAQLVIQSASLAEPGDLFLLDMGKPIKIIELAKQMIKLSGFKIKDDDNQEGDLEIKFTGLRPGEKMYEELLINSKSEPTVHPLIFKAKEEFFESEELMPKIKKIMDYISKKNLKEVLITLKEIIPEWEKAK